MSHPDPRPIDRHEYYLTVGTLFLAIAVAPWTADSWWFAGLFAIVLGVTAITYVYKAVVLGPPGRS